MRRERIQLTPEAAAAFLAEVLDDATPRRAHVVFPEVLQETAQSLAAALGERGVHAEVTVFAESTYRQADRAEASKGWVPDVTDDAELLVLFGAQPWETPFEDDHEVEIAAMKRREALIHAGRRLIFIDWPRGARLDREVDLSAKDMARIYGDSLTIDYPAMRETNAQLMRAVADAAHVHITCPEGTDVTLSVKDRVWLAEDCRLSAEEPAIYLPGGEIYVPAHETSAEGHVAFRHCGEARVAFFEAGRLMTIRDGQGARDAALEEEIGAGFEPLCEFGIGTNAWAPPWQIGTIYEKSSGTVHVAVGGNAHFGGERESARHADLIIRDPVVRVDGEVLTLPQSLWKSYGYGKETPR